MSDSKQRPAPALWIGWQSTIVPGTTIGLWTLTEDIPGFCKHSTVITETLLQLGYSVEEPTQPMTPSEQRQRLAWHGITWTVIILLLCAATTWGDHGHFTDHYKDAEGVQCCGPKDCSVVHARILAQNETYATVEINGVTIRLRSTSVHQSEDTQDYWCAKGHAKHISATVTRCVFIAAAG